MSQLGSDLELTGIALADVTFIQQLRESECSSIFQVAVHGKTCVMKVVCFSSNHLPVYWLIILWQLPCKNLLTQI